MPVQASSDDTPTLDPARELTPFTPQPFSPVGTWVLDGGSALPDFIQGLATFSTTADVTGLKINADGTGRVFFRDRQTDARDCARVFALFDGETMVLDFGAETTTDVVFNTALEDTTFFYPVVVASQDSLGIADETGLVALFSRVASIPPELDCGSLTVTDRFDGLPGPQFFTDLVLLNGNLNFNSGDGQIETFDLKTDTLIAPLGPSNSRLVQTVEDGFFWTHCGCGGSRDAFKRSLTTVVDTVSSESNMGGPITFRAIAYNDQTDRLWLHGRRFSDSFGRFFVTNTNVEPDVVEQEISFNRDLRALSFDNGALWGIVTVATQTVVQIDTTTGKVIASYEVPDEDVSWSGLTFDANNMYMVGSDQRGEGVLLRLQKP